MATKTKPKTSLVKNPVNPGMLTVKKTVKKRRRRNPTTKQTVKRKRRVLRRNPAASDLLGVFATAFVINAFDIVVNRFMPGLSGLVRTAAKFGGGYLIGKFGTRTPVIGQYSNLLSKALYLAGALDVVANYIMPPVVNFLMPPLPPPMPAVKQLPTTTTTAELAGDYEHYELPNGDELYIYEDESFSEEYAY